VGNESLYFTISLSQKVLHQLHLKLTTVLDFDGLTGHSTLVTNLLNLVHDVKSFDNLSEDTMFSIKPRSINSTDEELGSVAVDPRMHEEDVSR